MEKTLGKGEIFTRLEGKNIISETRGWGKNILLWANIHPWSILTG